jgi:hypothetical protein
MIAELSKTTKNTQVDDEVLILPYSVLRSQLLGTVYRIYLALSHLGGT